MTFGEGVSDMDIAISIAFHRRNGGLRHAKLSIQETGLLIAGSPLICACFLVGASALRACPCCVRCPACSGCQFCRAEPV
jgi:hypothetical protein